MRRKIVLLFVALVCCTGIRTYATIDKYIVDIQALGSGYLPGALPSSAGGIVKVGTDVYYTDPVNHIVCKRDASGVITVIAGNLGVASDGPYLGMSGYTGPSSCNLNAPTAIEYYNSNIYFTDVATHRACKIDLSTGDISSIVGQGSSGTPATTSEPIAGAYLNNPVGIAFDNLDNLYIADKGNNLIRKISLSATGTPVITVFAGLIPGATGYGTTYYTTGTTGVLPNTVNLDDVSGLTFSPLTYNMYFTELGAHKRVIMVDMSTLNMSTVAGNGTGGTYFAGSAPTSTYLDNPSYIRVGHDGNLYINNNNGIVACNSAGAGLVSDYAGNPSGASGGAVNCVDAVGATMDNVTTFHIVGNGEFTFADAGNHLIRRIWSTTFLQNLFYCSAAAGPMYSASLHVYNLYPGASAQYRTCPTCPWNSLTPYTTVTGLVGATYDIQVVDNGCTILLGTATINTPHSGPVAANLIAGTDISSGGSTLIEQTDCNCVAFGLDNFEIHTDYYWQKFNGTTWVNQMTDCVGPMSGFGSGYTTFAGWGNDPLLIRGNVSGPNVDLFEGSATSGGLYRILANRDGCTLPMDGLLQMVTPGSLPTQVLSATTDVLCPGSTTTLSLSNTTSGKTYRLYCSANPTVLFASVVSGGGTISFPAMGTAGIYSVVEVTTFVIGSTTYEVTKNVCSTVTITSRELGANMTAPNTVSGDKVYTACRTAGGAMPSVILTASIIGAGYISPTVTYSITGPGISGSLSVVVPLSSPIPAFPLFTPPSGGGTSFNYTITATPSLSTECSMSTVINIIVPVAGTCTPCEWLKVDKYTASPYSCTTTGCSDCSDVQPFHTITATTITGANIPTDGVNNVWIMNSATMTGTQTWGASTYRTVVFVSMGRSISIATTAKVAFRNSHIFSGDCIDAGAGSTPRGWFGFSILSTTGNVGRLSLIENTLVENVYSNSNASHAIDVTMPSGSIGLNYYDVSTGNLCVVNCDNSIINKCNYHMNLNYVVTPINHIYELPFHIENSIFTNREFECFKTGTATHDAYYPFTWPDVATLKTVVVEPSTGLIDAYDPRFDLDKYNSPYPAIGYAVSMYWKGGSTDAAGNFYELAIGNKTDPTKSNVFDNVRNVGIVCTTGGNMTVRNSIFRKLWDPSFNTKGIWAANSSSTQNRLRLLGDGTSSQACGNVFRHCALGVTVSGNYDVYGNQSTMSSYNSWTPGSGIGTGTITGPANEGYYLVTTSNKLEFLNNLIFNIRNGILVTATPTGTSVTADFNNNTIQAASPCTTCSSNFAAGAGPSMTGLYASTVAGGAIQLKKQTSTLNFARINMNGNKITGSGFGIVGLSTEMDAALGIPDRLMNINDNVISVKDYNTSSTLTPSGIYLFRSCKNNGRMEINRNDISGVDGPVATTSTLFNSSGYWDRVTKGMWIYNCGNTTTTTSLSNARCNYIHDINVAFNFDGDGTVTLAGGRSNVDWRNNTMKRANIGLALGGTAGFVSMGVQGGVSDPIDNNWEDDAALPFLWTGTHYTTWTMPACPAATGTMLYVRGTTLPYYPTNNGFSSASAPFGTTSITTTTGGSIDACVTATHVRGSNPISVNLPATQSYTLFPNPTTGNITINQNDVVDGVVAAKVINIVGASVFEGNIEFTRGQSQMNLQDITPGIYLVELKDVNGQRFTTKLVVEK